MHARSIVAAAVDGQTSELHQARLTPHLSTSDHGWRRCRVRLRWPTKPVRPVLVCTRDLTAAGIRCEVVAPSKLQRPVGDRVKTDGATRSTWRDYYGWGDHPVSILTGVEQEAARGSGPGPRRLPGRSDAGTSPAFEAVAAPRHGVRRWGGPGPCAHDRWLRTVAAPALTGVATDGLLMPIMNTCRR